VSRYSYRSENRLRRTSRRKRWSSQSLRQENFPEIRMRLRFVCINDLPIKESGHKFHWRLIRAQIAILDWAILVSNLFCRLTGDAYLTVCGTVSCRLAPCPSLDYSLSQADSRRLARWIQLRANAGVEPCHWRSPYGSPLLWSAFASPCSKGDAYAWCFARRVQHSQTSQALHTRQPCCGVMEESWPSSPRTKDSPTSSRSGTSGTIESPADS